MSGRLVDSHGIIPNMSIQGREALGAAVKRHREHRGWSRETMAKLALELLQADAPDPSQVRFSPSTVKNVETSEKEVTGRTAGAIERLFGWAPGTVAGILGGHPAPTPRDPNHEETQEDEDSRAFATFRTWPKDVQEVAMFVGGMMTWRSDAERTALKEQIYGLLLPDRRA